MVDSAKKGLKGNLATLLLLALAGSIIYGLPYYRYYYYDSYMNLYGLTNTQMGLLGSAYGLLGMFSYLIGGVLADKFNAKKLVVLSLILTGACGFLHLLTTDFILLVAIYVIWGLTSLLLFWPACVKMIRLQGSDGEQSRTYGVFEGTRGALNAGHLAIATVIFGFFEARAMMDKGIEWGIIFYSVTPIITGLLLLFLLKDPGKAASSTPKDRENSMKWSDIITLIKMPSVWLIILMVFGSYTFNISLSYYNPYAVNILGATAVVAAIITTSTQYIRPFASPIGGFIADKIGKGNLMTIGFVIMMSGLGIIMMSAKSKSGTVMAAGVLISYVGMYFCFGQHHAFMAEGKVPVRITGTCAGLVCTLGYLPEVIDPIVAGRILDTNTGVDGYYKFFTFMLACGALGLVASIIWSRSYGKKAKLESRNKEQENREV